MKKQNGFTLIELLAVIIILAVIALIATPIVLSVVDKAKENSRQSSVAGYADAAKLYVYDEQFKTNGQVPSNDEIKKNTTNQGDKVVCEEVLYSSNYGIVLHGCNVGDDTNKYYFASGKTYTDPTQEPYKTIYESTKKESGEVVLTGDKIGELVLNKFPNLALGSNGCATDNNNYSYMNGCYLKGAQTNNYIWFSGFLYRIMGINADGSVRMITEENVTVIPYNTLSSTFEGSYAESWLNEYFISNLKGTNKIVESKFCQGAVSSTTNLQRTDCTGGTEISKKVGLLSIDEYNLSGANTSYLKNTQYFWTMSPYSAVYAWYVSANGNATSNSDVIFVYGVRSVINVNSSTVITKGDGTLSDNYILNEDKTISITGKLNEKSSSGEYAKLGNKVYRVVGKNNDGTTKLILDSYYQETAEINYKMRYGGNNTFTTASGIGQKLNTSVLEWLAPDAITKNKIKTDSKWYQNPFTSGNSYTEAIKENATPITATVGLINIGEMLSGQSASILTKNHTTNSSYSNATNYWTLTPYTSAGTEWFVDTIGAASNYEVGCTLGVRSVININSDVTITSGNGTLSSPYEI